MNRQFVFGDFVLHFDGMLLHREQQISIPPKELAVLTALLEAAGELVSKDALLDRVWPDGESQRGIADPLHLRAAAHPAGNQGLSLHRHRLRQGLSLQPSGGHGVQTHAARGSMLGGGAAFPHPPSTGRGQPAQRSGAMSVTLLAVRPDRAAGHHHPELPRRHRHRGDDRPASPGLLPGRPDSATRRRLEAAGGIGARRRPSTDSP
ncbi:winged helix-turn-helix domain-containing protein [Chromobacterium haemolyticum]|nr:winged helix-turn-helix domain-containing protein [Chromobacterium haemolyticum]